MATNDPTRILIVGHGEMGQAMEYLLAPRHAVTIWHRASGEDLATAVRGAAAVIFAVPATPLFDLAARLRPALAAATLCISFSKGIDDAGRLPYQALPAALGPAQPLALLYGPMIAEEIRAARPAFAALGATGESTRALVTALFSGSALSLQPTDDLAGISWCAVLKNVYAMLFGAADELGLGDNTRGYLAQACTREMQRICVAQGGRADTAYGLAGLGDLLTTATSRGSSHNALGHRLARGDVSSLRAEGWHSLQMIEHFRLLDAADFPLLALMQRIAARPQDCRARFAAHLDALRARA
jgi:glycerol-3-phosphate dehydrogenase (NAD(P)+)